MRKLRMSRPWTETDVKRLIELRRKNKTVKSIALYLGRTEGAVSKKMQGLNFINGHVGLALPPTDPLYAQAENYLQRRGYSVFQKDDGFSVDGRQFSGAQMNTKAARVQANTALLAA